MEFLGESLAHGTCYGRVSIIISDFLKNSFNCISRASTAFPRLQEDGERSLFLPALGQKGPEKNVQAAGRTLCEDTGGGTPWGLVWGQLVASCLEVESGVCLGWGRQPSVT